MRSLHPTANMFTPISLNKQALLAKQRGVTLVVVLIFLLLAIISVLGAFRAGFLNEKIVGNESDYNRTFAAAEAMLRDAEMDIRGRRPPYDFVQPDGSGIGFPCRPATPGSPTDTTSLAGYEDSCRLRNSATTPWFPRDKAEFDQIEALVVAANPSTRCSQGICFPQSLADTTLTPAYISNISNISNIGAAYGSFTRTDVALANLTTDQSNPILATRNADGTALAPRAWYVIEAFILKPTICGSPGGCPATKFTPSTDRPFVYRITAVAQGLRQGTKVVLNSTFIPYPKSESP